MNDQKIGVVLNELVVHDGRIESHQISKKMMMIQATNLKMTFTREKKMYEVCVHANFSFIPLCKRKAKQSMYSTDLVCFYLRLQHTQQC